MNLQTTQFLMKSQKIQRIAAYLAGFEFWLIAFLVGASVIYSRALPVVVGIAVLFGMIRVVVYGRLTIRTPADWAMILLIITALVSLGVTAVPEKTSLQVLRLLSGIALGYSIINWAVTLPRLKLLVHGLVLVGFAFVLFAPFSVTWNIGKLSFIPQALYSRFAVLVADTVHPNTMGATLVSLLPILLGIILFGWREISRLERGWMSLVLVLMLVVILLTKSRGAWVAVLFVFILEFLLMWRRGWWLVLLVAVGALLIATFSGFPTFIEALTTNESLGGIQGRLEIWSRAINIIGDYPFTGIGIGSYVEIVDLFYPHTFFEPGEIVHAHNLFLQIAVDLGLPGLIAWLAIYFLVTAAGWRIFKHARAQGRLWLSGLGAGLLGSQLTIGIHGVTDASTWGIVRTAPLIWGFWGLTFAALYLSLQDDKSGEVGKTWDTKYLLGLLEKQFTRVRSDYASIISWRNFYSLLATNVKALGLILSLTLVNGLIFVFLIPPWQHYDEPGHFEYAWFIAHRSRQPEPGEFDPAMRRELAASMISNSFYDRLGAAPDIEAMDLSTLVDISQVDEPQLYYRLLSFALKLVATAPLEIQLWLGRITNLVYFFLTVLAGWGMVRELTAENNPIRWIFPITLAILPSLANTMTAVNNDAAAIAFFSLFLWGSMRLIQRGFSWESLLLTASATLLCAMTKSTAIIAVPLSLVPILFSILRRNRRVAWWILVGSVIGLILAFFSYGDAQFWYRSTLQAESTRVASHQAVLGKYILRIDPKARVSPRWLRPMIQPIPEQSVRELAGEIVTVGAWMWSSHPLDSRLPVLNDGKQAYSKQVKLSLEPQFFSYQVKIPNRTERMWMSLIPGSRIIPDEVEIYYDGLVLADGFRPEDQPPVFSDESGSSGEWGGTPFHNYLRNSSAEEGALRIRNWVTMLGSRIFPEYGGPAFIFSSLTDPQGSIHYYRAAILRLFRTFWGEFGWGNVPLLGHKPYRILGFITLIGILGAVVYLWRNVRQIPWDLLFLFGVALIVGWGESLVRSVANLATTWYYLPVARYAYIVILPTVSVIFGGWLAGLNYVGQRLRIPPGVRYVVYFSILVWIELFSVASILYFY